MTYILHTFYFSVNFLSICFQPLVENFTWQAVRVVTAVVVIKNLLIFSMTRHHKLGSFIAGVVLKFIPQCNFSQGHVCTHTKLQQECILMNW